MLQCPVRNNIVSIDPIALMDTRYAQYRNSMLFVLEEGVASETWGGQSDKAMHSTGEVAQAM